MLFGGKSAGWRQPGSWSAPPHGSSTRRNASGSVGVPEILRVVGIVLMGFGAAVAPATLYLWLETNFANANVRYNASLVWSIGIACIAVHRAWATAKAQEEVLLKHTEN